MDQEDALAVLEASLEGVAPPVPDEDEVAEYEAEVEELDEQDIELAEALHPGLADPLRLTGKGEEMLFVTHMIERWLRRRPQGPLSLGIAAARALAPMVLSWSATLTHALAPGPQTSKELERTLAAVLDAEAVEGQLESMVDSGQAEALYGSGRAPSYLLTDWGREAISPIVAAVRFELRHPDPGLLPPDVFDVEAAFQMALPLLRLPEQLRGTCRAGVRIPDEPEPLVAGATVEVAEGRVAASSPLLEQTAETWASGTPLEWCEAVVDPTAAGLDAGGDTGLVAGLVEALHERLFGESPEIA
ncbi:MAG TPA: hypothetical protein VFG58_07610 [Solirubrobacterales bacterium]|nr:hypothetical protein [Solirubrobacterales bacterium]